LWEVRQMNDHRTVEWAIDILGMCEPIRCHQGGMWFGRNQNFADATFVDYGAADAFAVAARELPKMAKSLDEALGIIHDLLGLELGSSDRAMKFLDDHTPTADAVRGILAESPAVRTTGET
jgi:hypothetical protein